MRHILLMVFVGCFAFETTSYSSDSVQMQPPGVVFRLVSLDPTISVPPRSSPLENLQVLGGWEFTRTPFSDGAFVLRLTNVSTTLEAFSFIDTWSVVVVGPDGQTLQQKGGRDATHPPERGEFKNARSSETVNFLISYKLSYDKAGKLVLWGDDGLGGIWACGPVAPGKYKVHVEYGFDPKSGNTLWHQIAEEKLGIRTSSLWVGDGKSNEVELEIR